MRLLKLILCLLLGHRRVSDGSWGGYGWTDGDWMQWVETACQAHADLAHVKASEDR